MKVCVLDLDGTLINPSKSSMRERDMIYNHIKSENNRLNLTFEAERYTLEHPLDFSWTYKDLSAAFAEDSYTWRSAQAKYLWDRLETDKTQDDFINTMYFNAIKNEKISLMKGAKEFIEYLFDSKVQPVIVSNSSTAKGQKCCQALQFDIPVYGNAKKYAVEKEYPFLIDGRESYSFRPEYERILMQIMAEYKAEHKDIFCVGDIFTLDLSLPHRLGMNCIFLKNNLEDGFKTPQIFIDYVQKLDIPVFSDLESSRLI